MKRMLTALLSLGLLFGSSAAMMACCNPCPTDNCCDNCQDCCNICGSGCPHFVIRSQSVNAARDLVGWQKMINLFEMEDTYGAFAITPEYTRSFRPCRITGYFFGEAYKEGKLTVSGSRKGATAADQTTAVARGEFEWLADYFGLAPNFESTVQFKPRIQNFLVDLSLYLGLDELWEGGFFRINAPIVWTRWELNPCETIVTEGDLGYDAGYMGEAAVPFADLDKSWLTAMKGDTMGADVKEKLKYGKIADCKLTKTRLSDIQMVLGWNFLTDEDYHLGLGIRAAFPTGNKPCAEYLFEPVVGNTGHFELGGHITSHAVLWTSEDEESDCCVYLDANITHLFKRKLMRSFDLKDKPNSRYMLIEEMGTPVANLLANDYTGEATAVKPNAQYQGNLFPLINKSTCCTDVRIAVQGDMVIKFAYTSGNWSWDLGYNLWGRSGEKFNTDCCTDCCLEKDSYALKGDAFVYGFVANNATQAVGVPARGSAVPMSATQSKADIYGGKNTPTGTAYTAAHRLNPSIDNPAVAFPDPSGNADNALQFAVDAYDVNNRTHTSNKAILLTCDDLVTCNCASALTHKIFTHFSYAWKDREEDEWIPFFGIGAEVEFAGQSDGVYGSVSQWGIWLKGGLSFD